MHQRTRRLGFIGAILFLAVTTGLLAASGAGAQTASESSFAGKRFKIVVGAAAGGGNDIYGRILARHLPTHIPGKPTIIIVNMQGASSISATNYMANIAPKDGSELLEIVQALPLVQAFGQENINFDLAAFHWVGNMTDSPVVYVTWRDSPVKDVESARKTEIVFGSTSPNSLFSMMPLVMNKTLGTRFKVVNGYDSGKAIELATERGEVGGFGGSTWSSLAIDEPEWISQKKINILAQAGLRKAKELADVPLLTELQVRDEDRAVLKFYSGVVAFARAFALGPDVPADRVAVWRRAFDDTMKDKAFLAEATAMKLDINPVGGEALQKIVADTVHADRELIARAQAALGN